MNKGSAWEGGGKVMLGIGPHLHAQGSDVLFSMSLTSRYAWSKECALNMSVQVGGGEYGKG